MVDLVLSMCETLGSIPSIKKKKKKKSFYNMFSVRAPWNGESIKSLEDFKSII